MTIAFASMLGLLAAAPVSAKDGGASETVTVMHAAFEGVIALQPYLASQAAFRDPANATKIGAALRPLSALRHRFMGQEPGAEVLAALFGESVDRAVGDLKVGNFDAARSRLRSVTSLCFACHTRERSSKNFEDAGKQVDALALPPLRKAEFLATTRQFDQAALIWNQALQAAPTTEDDAFNQAAALRQYVAVLVRVKDDRTATVGLLMQQLNRKDLPLFVTRPLQSWLTDAQAWKADPFDARTATPTALFAKAKELVENSGATLSAMTDDRRFITVLRATGYLHTALEKQPRGAFRSEALYFLGVASAATNDPLLWEVDSLYLTACVHENPHSAIARRCVNRIYERAWFGWTGSSGTQIPPDVAEQLGKLRVLAQ